MTPRRRVAITGLGVKSPAGLTVDETVDTLLAAKSTAATLPELVEGRSPVTFACRVPHFDPSAYVTVRESRQMDRSAVLMLAAAVDAVRAAGLDDPAGDEMGVSVGIGAAGLDVAREVVLDHGGEPGEMPVYTVLRIMANAPAARIGLRLGARGPCLTYSTACASGATAIGEAAQKIRSGELERVVAGGVDSALSPLVLAAFSRIGALSQRGDDPSAASRPFDRDRDGFVMGEGAAAMVLERWDRAVARGAPILGEVLGYASTSDAHHIVAPVQDGSTAAACMRLALADAALQPAEIGHVNAHGTATVLNDRAEARGIAACFGGDMPPVTASKGVTGHLLGGAGAFEAVAALACASRGLVPPVANLGGGPDADLLDLVTAEPRRIAPAPVLSNSFGFGGHNACLVLAPLAWQGGEG
ncbi:beta-ketoacyl synthase [Microbispora sp. H11081]|uniref:beta-ketoacyl-[acyl-carrier-protein] synthase family protein n=1 Tax=Microbispora sp. H11081 TaxID=2729107 RepID=UPI0014765975|nr:beta-ketoacyl-[acyl-carrier-protein] synthase family protein [Microbispora sp. H11081]